MTPIVMRRLPITRWFRRNEDGEKVLFASTDIRHSTDPDRTMQRIIDEAIRDHIARGEVWMDFS